MIEVAEGVYRIPDTCHVYLIRSETDPTSGICIDFGAGEVLDHLAEVGIERVTDVLMTHHHRDQGQGLPRAVAHGARIHVPPVEVELFAAVEEMWQTRQLDNDDNLRQDWFSLTSSVPVAGTVPEYRTADFGGTAITTIPTPGHTVGSVAYLLERGGRRLAFSGDLIHSPGKVWSLAATQWTYTGREGPSYLAVSAVLLARREPDLLLPSHGDPMDDPRAALGLLAERISEYAESRSEHAFDGLSKLDDPFVVVTPHLLLNTSSWMSASYVLLSETGEALLIDYGYDMFFGSAWGNDRSSRRPWLESLPALRRRHGVRRVSVAIPTHYHDDHVAGMPLLRDVEGTELWIPGAVAEVLADPWAHDLPCQWYDPIPADRVLPDDGTFEWNEYTIGVHPQPGHTMYAVAYSLSVDGIDVVFTGDQQEGMGGPDGARGSHGRDVLNYQYRNRFRLGDYVASAQLYRRLAPGLLASGHWQPRTVTAAYLDYLADEGQALDARHRELLPLDDLDLGADGAAVRLSPYRAAIEVGEELTITARVRNPFSDWAAVLVRVVPPRGWHVVDGERKLELDGHTEAETVLTVRASTAGRRQPVAVDVTVGEVKLGQQAHVVVDVWKGQQ
ncbi:MBL fold metallo-hydrolase [Pseudactinotalea suaedae]|uniref:MBL fold metallo-hydrolase n=1 Tax=Pseudactinotalea suaedae TaxID=1524924 RepID=UPI001F4FC698|nr:MBL fold metallo-hydrolase [Pseudactinotalea suaedae]